MYTLRYQMSNGGNLSVRIPGKDQMMVKGTDVGFDEVKEGTLVVMDFQGKVIWGKTEPSKEALLHAAIYSATNEVNAVMHCHSPFATAWAANHESLQLSTHHARMKLRENVPVFDSHSYVVPEKFFPEIMSIFSQPIGGKAFLLRGHGQVTLGKTMREAVYLAELVEETAQIALLSGAGNG